MGRTLPPLADHLAASVAAHGPTSEFNSHPPFPPTPFASPRLLSTTLRRSAGRDTPPLSHTAPGAGTIQEKRSVYRVSIFSDVFWGAVNLIGLL